MTINKIMKVFVNNTIYNNLRLMENKTSKIFLKEVK